MSNNSRPPPPPLYRDPNFIHLDETRKNLISRREVLNLKSQMRANAVSDLSAAKKRGVDKALRMFAEKNNSALNRNKELLHSMRSAKQAFKRITASTNNSSRTHFHLQSTRKEYITQIEALFPAWKEMQTTANVASINKLEQQKQQANMRRQAAKEVSVIFVICRPPTRPPTHSLTPSPTHPLPHPPTHPHNHIFAQAFEKEQQVRKIVDEKKSDLAITQLLEHNEEMERVTRRHELDIKGREIDSVLFSEATKAGKLAQGRIVEASIIEVSEDSSDGSREMGAEG